MLSRRRSGIHSLSKKTGDQIGTSRPTFCQNLFRGDRKVPFACIHTSLDTRFAPILDTVLSPPEVLTTIATPGEFIPSVLAGLTIGVIAVPDEYRDDGRAHACCASLGFARPP
jgi:hypothetical protein